MTHERACGVLLHPTSLPGPYGIGELGSAAFELIDFLEGAGQRYWQILPLGHTGYGDSPYQSFSAFAGNPLLISIDLLLKDGFLKRNHVDPIPGFPDDRVNYGDVIPYKYKLLNKAWGRYKQGGFDELKDDYHKFWLHNHWWLDDYALFVALKNAHNGAAWTEWDPALVSRQPEALEQWTKKLKDETEAAKLWQFLFHRQWQAVKREANDRGILIIGDIPIYVAHDSADVWANQHLFYLDEKGRPEVVAGVPPDYFSETGQLWGNPIYRWDVARDNGYSWWTPRFREILNQVDIVRLDHFRGFQAYWEVPGEDDTAMNGRWVEGPAHALFDHLQNELGAPLPIIAENLGVITDDVEALRKHYGLPGMEILQFAFGSDAANSGLPHNYECDTVAYTGTHDNDTIVGWWKSAGDGDSTRSQDEVEAEHEYAREYLNTDGNEIHWDAMRALAASVANTVVFPAQDLIGLGAGARMNFPGRPAGNWQWRMKKGALTESIQQRLRRLCECYGRVPLEPESDDEDAESGAEQ